MPNEYASARRASVHSPRRISGAVKGRVPGWICSGSKGRESESNEVGASAGVGGFGVGVE